MLYLWNCESTELLFGGLPPCCRNFLSVTSRISLFFGSVVIFSPGLSEPVRRNGGLRSCCIGLAKTTVHELGFVLGPPRRGFCGAFPEGFRVLCVPNFCLGVPPLAGFDGSAWEGTPRASKPLLEGWVGTPPQCYSPILAKSSQGGGGTCA